MVELHGKLTDDERRNLAVVRGMEVVPELTLGENMYRIRVNVDLFAMMVTFDNNYRIGAGTALTAERREHLYGPAGSGCAH